MSCNRESIDRGKFTFVFSTAKQTFELRRRNNSVDYHSRSLIFIKTLLLYIVQRLLFQIAQDITQRLRIYSG